ncbi:MAG: FCD domain-containing protein [Planctomycetota bacterium]
MSNDPGPSLFTPLRAQINTRIVNRPQASDASPFQIDADDKGWLSVWYLLKEVQNGNITPGKTRITEEFSTGPGKNSDLKLGSRLKIREISASLRPTVCFSLLEHRKRRTRVEAPPLEDVDQLHTLRRLVEAGTSRRASRYIDQLRERGDTTKLNHIKNDFQKLQDAMQQFRDAYEANSDTDHEAEFVDTDLLLHEYVAFLAGTGKYGVQLVRSIVIKLQLVGLRHPMTTEMLDDIIHEHQRLIGDITHGQPSDAEDAMLAHLNCAASRYDLRAGDRSSAHR